MNNEKLNITKIKEFDEIKIKVPWGHISGKWYGSTKQRPILALHGWLDNAGTFDKLIPLLFDENLSFLTIDLPGHGRSSWFPDGMYYHITDFVNCINLIMKEYQWEKVSLIGHSLGSIVSFLFASFYPAKVDLLIGIDALKPATRPINYYLDENLYSMDMFLIADEKNRMQAEPPSYYFEELIQRIYVGSNESVEKENAIYLIKRNVKKSPSHPDKYVFSYDQRVKHYDKYHGSPDYIKVMTRRISAPQMYIKAIGKNTTYYEEKIYFNEIISILEEKKDFEFYEINGTHHVHLNNPELLSDKIKKFLNKHHNSSNKKNKL